MEANSLDGGQKFVVEGSGEALSLPEWVECGASYRVARGYWGVRECI